MKITIVDEKHEVSVTLDTASDITELGVALKGLIVAYGFHPDNVDDLFNLERWTEEKQMEERRSDYPKILETLSAIKSEMAKVAAMVE